MRTVVFAYHDIGVTAIQTLLELGVEICAVFTHEDDPNENVWFGSVIKTLNGTGIPVYTPPDPNTSEWLIKINDIKPDIIFSFYYRKLISDSILAIPPKGALNLHGSLLPKYRGRAPVNWVLVKGEKETGLTLHYMIKKPDAGDIVAQKKTIITDDDTALSLYRKLLPLAEEMLLETVPLLEKGNAPRNPQDESRATVFKGRKPEDGKIYWTHTSRDIFNLVRAVTHPYPGAFTFLNGKKVFIWKCRNIGVDSSSVSPFSKGGLRGISRSPGTVISLRPFEIICGAGTLVLESVQTENGPESNSVTWAEKNSVKLGTMLV